MNVYPELDNLDACFEGNNILIKRNPTKDIQSLKTLELELNNSNFIIYIDDEYNDVKEDNQLMCFFLILRELEIFKESTDYIVWCNQLGTKANDEQLRKYYITLGPSYQKIEKMLGEIDSYVSSLDYQLSTGVIQKLRNY